MTSISCFVRPQVFTLRTKWQKLKWLDLSNSQFPIWELCSFSHFKSRICEYISRGTQNGNISTRRHREKLKRKVMPTPNSHQISGLRG